MIVDTLLANSSLTNNIVENMNNIELIVDNVEKETIISIV